MPIVHKNLYSEFSTEHEGDGTHKSITTNQIAAPDDNGLALYDNDSNGIFVEDGGQVGIGTTEPTNRLEVAGSAGLPATSGSSDNASLRIGYTDHSWGGVALYTGIHNLGDYPAWIQARNPNDYSANRPLLLNPNGGPVGIGYTATGTGSLNINGNVGIGTTGPGAQVNGVAVGVKVHTLNTSPGVSGIAQLSEFQTDTATRGPRLGLARARASAAAVLSGDNLGAIHWYGHDGNDYNEAAAIWAEVDATPGANDMPGRLIFGTTPDGTGTRTPQEWMTIKEDGNVGIGLTEPARLLHAEVSDAVTNAVTYAQRLSHISSGTVAANFGTGIEFELEGADGTNLVTGAIENILTDASTGSEDADLIFKVAAGGAVATEQFRIASDGGLFAQTLLQQSAAGLVVEYDTGTKELYAETSAMAFNSSSNSRSSPSPPGVDSRGARRSEVTNRAFPRPPGPPRAATNSAPSAVRSARTSWLRGSQITVPTGTRTMRFRPRFPCCPLPRPCCPSAACQWGL